MLYSLAVGYRATGDMEAAIRSGLQGLALFRASEATKESASVENELALIYIGLGNLREAAKHAGAARAAFESAGDEFWLAHVAETEAQIALAKGNHDEATTKAAAATELARKTGNQKAEISALLTGARAARARGETGPGRGDPWQRGRARKNRAQASLAGDPRRVERAARRVRRPPASV